ncbi:FMN-dependent oxidoreductase (nitrilotriacetate monooxygenase family) [Saccharopolyspora lacisalsi]|uniref:FMN-dependent oxidoreductase (Nitrilotriacetate monooxygenase family) n=1 Tax=Halosaccharopolyspora lacisalsi TaxID=1000566 RepID=A0A839DTC1_9PSEU|nr:LLM class flavin-dependent oxidoreductase [Halosaccharopolyspora lacisalsi]MBA8823999.1 FMN-dependent oxidoreductase (nitrilotriacetate monooxygenase family) [Halosaccharopolyspora lacisalsi]
MLSRRMRLFAFDFQGPAHLSAGLWRHEKDQSARYKDVHYWTEYAKLLEQGRFDGVFFADNVGYHDVYQGSAAGALADGAQLPANDPALVVSAMAAATEHLGFGLTGSTTYDHPYALSRKFSTLDHLTDGRVGWNLVTSYADSAARNLGNGQLTPHDERYDVAAEHLEVCYKLWEGSWEDGAVVRDTDRCVQADPERVHDINHQGKYFNVPGFALCEPSPQRTPVIFQAGGSSKGRALAAAHAEGVFVNSVSKSALKRQVETLRGLAAESGRDPRDLRVLQMLNVICAPTDEQAYAKYEEYRKLVSYSGAMARYSGWTALDMSQFDPDVPLRHVKTDAGQTMIDLFSKMDPDKEWTPRDIADFIGIGGSGPTIVGSPQTVADELISWVEETDVDGFNLGHAVKYQDIADFVELVVPELQRREAVWTEYEGKTLREKLYGPGAVRLRDDHPGRKFGHAALGAGH